jgi:hypothetical protein
MRWLSGRSVDGSCRAAAARTAICQFAAATLANVSVMTGHCPWRLIAIQVSPVSQSGTIGKYNGRTIVARSTSMLRTSTPSASARGALAPLQSVSRLLKNAACNEK